VAAFARRHGRRFIFAVGALEDCLTNLPHCRTRRERVLYRYGLRRADRVIAQTQQQQALLRESFGVESTLVRSCGGDPTRSTGILPVTHGLEGRATGDRGDAPPVHRVLWIGRFTAQKRLEMLFDVAERCPNVQFDVVGEGDTDDPYVRELQARGTGLANVALHGRVPHNQVSTFYRRAGLLLCTSSAEGFPNTFLEAWSQGIPVVSTFDPDGLIVDRALGAVAAQGPELASAIRGLLDARERLHELGGNCRRYYLQNHALEAVLPRLESIILDLQSSIGP
jgi:glycosyltransferase involved in cell wall biosynthesis